MAKHQRINQKKVHRDSMLTDEALVDLLRKRCDQHGYDNWCRMHGFHYSFVNQVLKGKKSISERLAKQLGFEPEPRRWRPVW
jgi:hypothetical protein